MWTKLRELEQEEKIFNSPDISKCGWKHLTPRLKEVADFPKWNNADIDWYEDANRSTSSKPKLETPLQLYQEEDAIL